MKHEQMQDRDAPGLESMLEVKLQDLPKKRGSEASRPRIAKLSNQNVV